MPRRLLSAAAAGALLLGLAACGDVEEGPVTTAPPEINVNGPSDGGGDAGPSDGGGEETDEATAAAPDIPPPDPADYAGMDEKTEDGAIQAFRYYIAVSMWAHQTGEDSELLELQTDACEGCPGFNAELPKLQEQGLYWSEFTVRDVKLTPHDSENFDYEIGYSFTIPDHTRPDPESGEPVAVDPIEYIAVGGLTWSTDRWVTGGLLAEWGSDVHS
ncbi:hypothetical protein H3H54_06370 [Brachybacterium sp. Z12]|uniref:DUF6318 family protein n=1 Tax=Brachybacterium sp. Z12 TaxID=2759167 RepID=UPI00185FE15C|nr:DUF6318 family protein [Brachybacterium sp. Z12]QNN83236.1 hypothetical protein H3H54_06370 [Brachybacterium sp. Z12]